jgi:hypothetical protein
MQAVRVGQRAADGDTAPAAAVVPVSTVAESTARGATVTTTAAAAGGVTRPGSAWPALARGSAGTAWSAVAFEPVRARQPGRAQLALAANSPDLARAAVVTRLPVLTARRARRISIAAAAAGATGTARRGGTRTTGGRRPARASEPAAGAAPRRARGGVDAGSGRDEDVAPDPDAERVRAGRNQDIAVLQDEITHAPDLDRAVGRAGPPLEYVCADAAADSVLAGGRSVDPQAPFGGVEVELAREGGRHRQREEEEGVRGQPCGFRGEHPRGASPA